MPSHEITIEQQTLELVRPSKDAITQDSRSEIVATSLLSVLGRKATEITVANGQLTIAFETGLTLRVEPDDQYESWQISSDRGALIVCMPGGELAVWHAGNR